MVSQHENISLDEVWELPVIQFLNDLVYLKAKRNWENEQAKKEAQRLKNAKY